MATLDHAGAAALIEQQGNKHVVIPEGITNIGQDAFKDTSLTSVDLPSTLTSIGNLAFFNTPLTSVDLPSTLTSIGAGAFQDTQLTSIDLPSTFTSIGKSVFAGTQLTSVVILEGVTSIGAGAFKDSSLTSVDLPSTLTSIGDFAFEGTSLTSVVIPEGVTIGHNSFDNSVSLISAAAPAEAAAAEAAAAEAAATEAAADPSVTLSSTLTAVQGSLTQTDLDNGYIGDQLSDIWLERTSKVTGEGNSVPDQIYRLDVYGSTDGDYDLTSFDINLKFDSDVWEAIGVSSNLGISDEFKYFNSADYNGSGGLRVVGGSGDGGYLNGGTGVVDGNNDVLFSVEFVANDSNPDYEWGTAYASSTDFSYSINSNDTILRDSDASTAAEENFVNATGSGSATYSINELVSDVEYTASNLDFVTDLVIGTNDSTNLIREGSTLEAKGTLNYVNDGQASAYDPFGTTLYASSIDGATLSITDKTQTLYVGSGTKELSWELTVDSNAAGKVIDYSGVSIGQSFSNGDSAYADNTILDLDSNLVTYQADINYDGRVSMMDLATLNAAAKADGNGVDISSVDVDYSGDIGISDLVKMDAQWGSSLHTLDDMKGKSEFMGTNGISIELGGSDIAGSGSTDNDIFIGQNATENGDPDFVDSLIDSMGTSTHHADAHQFDDSTTSELVEV